MYLVVFIYLFIWVKIGFKKWERWRMGSLCFHLERIFLSRSACARPTITATACWCFLWSSCRWGGCWQCRSVGGPWLRRRCWVAICWCCWGCPVALLGGRQGVGDAQRGHLHCAPGPAIVLWGPLFLRGRTVLSFCLLPCCGDAWRYHVSQGRVP
jgi:hypothetical protein